MGFWIDDRGNTLASTITGAVIGTLMLTLIATGLSTVMTFYVGVTATNSITASKAALEQQLRTDTIWASNISSETASPQGFTAVIPQRQDGTCLQVRWELAGNGKTKLTRYASTYTQTLPPATNIIATSGDSKGASTCGGQLKHTETRDYLNDAGSTAAFEYMNVAGVALKRQGAVMTAPAPTASHVVEAARQSSTRIAGITLTASAAASGSKASTVRINQYARNLEHKSIALKSYPVDSLKLGG